MLIYILVIFTIILFILWKPNYAINREKNSHSTFDIKEIPDFSSGKLEVRYDGDKKVYIVGTLTGLLNITAKMIKLIESVHEHGQKIGKIHIRNDDFLTDDSLEVVISYIEEE
jgi:hypothetical protein